ncbi:MAG: ACP S-malonyltransferase [Deltaproteobacteria bacterium]|nr:ACP S-malonyltransferase [Deltaproteobacteria bacterium]
MIAVAFPGQGSQHSGMGKDFYENVSVSRDTYHEAADVLGWDVASMCFGEDERLNLTEYAQPCILATEIAMLRGLRSLYGFDPEYFGGHSLGEYTALVASGALPFPSALEIVQNRGRLMQEATPVGMGGMAAVISDDLDTEMLRQRLENLPIDVANENSANQTVISGRLRSMPEAEARIKACVDDDQAVRFVPLNVSAPFHSRFMDSIKETFEEILSGSEAKLQPARAEKVTSNFTGLFHSSSSKEIIDRLVSQLSNTVQWRKNMETLAAQANSIFEIGPGRPLRAFFKAMNVACRSITTFRAAEKVFENVDSLQTSHDESATGSFQSSSPQPYKWIL